MTGPGLEAAASRSRSASESHRSGLFSFSSSQLAVTGTSRSIGQRDHYLGQCSQQCPLSDPWSVSDRSVQQGLRNGCVARIPWPPPSGIRENQLQSIEGLSTV